MPVTLNTYNNGLKLEPATYPQQAQLDAAMLGPSLTLAAGTVLGKKTSNNLLYAYLDTATDGTQTACAILVYATATDASGNHYTGTSASPSDVNLPHRDCSVYVAGTFRTTDLTGYDAAAGVDFHARVLPSAFIRIP